LGMEVTGVEVEVIVMSWGQVLRIRI
jgi:hypothetical protein